MIDVWSWFADLLNKVGCGLFAAEHISFGYVEESRVFDDLSFSIQK